MKRYLLFGGHRMTPQGGWGDFRGAFDSPSDAAKSVLQWAHAGKLKQGELWWHVVDSATGTIVSSQDNER